MIGLILKCFLSVVSINFISIINASLIQIKAKIQFLYK